MRAQYIEHQLRDRAARRPTFGVDARTRFAIRSDHRLAGLGEKVHADLLRAIGEVGDGLRNAVLVIVRDPRFQRLPVASKRGFLAALSVAESVEHVAVIQSLIVAPLFDRLGVGVQTGFGRLLEARSFEGTVSKASRALAYSSGFQCLGSAEQMELIRWIGGPLSSAAPVDAHWSRQRTELTSLVAEIEPMEPELAAEILRDFLHLPDRVVSFFRAANSDHRGVVFGELCDPNALSYGQVGSSVIARPDPNLGTLMGSSDRASASTYQIERATLSRLEEQYVVDWLERTLDLAGVRRTLEMVASSRGGLEVEMTYIAGGLVWVDESDCEELLLLDRLISDYMAGQPLTAARP